MIKLFPDITYLKMLPKFALSSILIAWGFSIIIAPLLFFGGFLSMLIMLELFWATITLGMFLLSAYNCYLAYQIMEHADSKGWFY